MFNSYSILGILKSFEWRFQGIFSVILYIYIKKIYILKF